MIHPMLPLLLLLFISPVLPLPGKEFTWQHSPSPYRAEFNCIRQNLPADTGLILTIPDCATTEQHGRDVFCFDQQGKELFRQTLGKGIHNTALLLVRPENQTEKIFAYWGSGMHAPEARIDSYAGLLAEMLEFTPDSRAENWKGLQPILRHAPSVGLFHLKNPLVMENPVDSRDSFIIRIRGFIPADRNWQQTWFVAADDSGYFLLDGALQIERPGRNYVHSSLRGEYKKDLSLSPGLHPAELIGVNFAGRSAIALGKLPGNPAPTLVTGEDFLTGGEAQFLSLSSRRGGAVPIFTYSHKSYISLNGFPLTETEYSLYDNQQDARWQFSDGFRTTGKSFTRIHLSTASLSLKVRSENRRGEGQIDFPSQAPDKYRSPNSPEHYNHYAALLFNQWQQGMRDDSVLPALIDFFLYYDLRKEAIPVLQYTIQEHSLSKSQKRRLLLALARCASVHAPEIAKEAFDQLLPLKNKAEKRSEIVGEAIEFAIFKLRDARLAEYWMRQYGLAFHDQPARLTCLKMDLAYLRKNEAEFRNCQNKIQNIRRQNTEKLLHSSVQCNAMEEKIKKLIQKDFLLQARQLLQELENLNPNCRLNGSLALLRARLFRKMDWLPGALDALNAAIFTDSLLPNLPDIEMMKADLLYRTGQKKQAHELYHKISKEYPNHPAARQAAVLEKK